jgi:hypothetical protein
MFAGKKIFNGQFGVKYIMRNIENTTKSYESKNDSFSKSNTLISGKYKATLLEQKLLNIFLAQLQQPNYIDKGEAEGLVCTIEAKELKKNKCIRSPAA